MIFFKGNTARKRAPVAAKSNKNIDKKMTIRAISDELAHLRTKKKEFLAQTERIVPWKEWVAMIQPCYYK